MTDKTEPETDKNSGEPVEPNLAEQNTSVAPKKDDEEQVKETVEVAQEKKPSQVEPVSSSTDSPKSKPNSKDSLSEPKKGKSKGLIISIIILLLLCVLLAVSLGMGWYWVDQKISQLGSDSKERELAFATSVDLINTEENLANKLQRSAAENKELKQQLNLMEQRVSSLNLRLISMSTTSREDWLLAEAEYLLKLANQRVLVERNAETAIALLEEADTILRDLANPDLFELRKAIKEDLVALKLAEKLDVEGLYLELAALSEKVEELPLVPEAYHSMVDSSDTVAQQSAGDKSALQNFIDSFKSYVRVIDHSEKPAAILPPDETAYLHLNLRFMLERAQIALLREQQTVYEKTLVQATQWVHKYFPNSKLSDEYGELLKTLSEKDIVANLPDISGSLQLLHDYIATMHKLGEGDKNSTEPVSDSQEAL